MLPIVYTPTVGLACMNMSHILRKFRGVYITQENFDRIDLILQNVETPEVFLIVVTVGERILGLGDLGSDGMGILVGKINLYVASAGLNPAGCLPITLDVGTNSERLLNDPLYLGVHKKRLQGEEYDIFIERFVLGIKRNSLMHYCNGKILANLMHLCYWNVIKREFYPLMMIFRGQVLWCCLLFIRQ